MVNSLKINGDKTDFIIFGSKPATGCAKKKKDILNIHIKSEGINIFSQKFCCTESTMFVIKCQKFTFIFQLFIT